VDNELDEMDQLLVEYLAAGMTDSAAALKVGCSSKTVQRRRKDPTFGAALAARKADRVAQVAAMLGEAAVDAVATMRDGLSAERDSDRLRAAAMIVNSLLRIRAAAETEDVIEELKTDMSALRNEVLGGAS
jgi:hypothetical protein